jgi:hypothetical protein
MANRVIFTMQPPSLWSKLWSYGIFSLNMLSTSWKYNLFHE